MFPHLCSFCLLCTCAHSYLCSHARALSYSVFSRVSSHMCPLMCTCPFCAHSYLCCRACALTPLRRKSATSVCSYVIARVWFFVCVHVRALMCALSFLCLIRVSYRSAPSCALMCALVCVLRRLCSIVAFRQVCVRVFALIRAL